MSTIPENKKKNSLNNLIKNVMKIKNIQKEIVETMKKRLCCIKKDEK